jgi:hypothetical protein
MGLCPLLGFAVGGPRPLLSVVDPTIRPALIQADRFRTQDQDLGGNMELGLQLEVSDF